MTFSEDFSKMIHYGIMVHEGIKYEENCYFSHKDCETGRPLTGDGKRED